MKILNYRALHNNPNKNISKQYSKNINSSQKH